MPSEFDLDWEDVVHKGLPLRRNLIPSKSETPRGTIVCIPGFSASGRSFARLAPLSDEFELHFVAPPLETSYPGNAVESQSEVIADYVAGLENVLLLGTSFGGLVSLRVATMVPERVRGIVLIGAFARGTGFFPIGFSFMKRILPVMQIAAAPLAPVTARVVGGRTIDDQGKRAIVEDTRTINAAERARRLRTIFRTDLTPLLCEIEAPSLVIHGTADRLVPIHLAREMASILPDARYHEIPRCGHLPYVTHPAKVLEILGDFLEQIFPGRLGGTSPAIAAGELTT